MQIDRSNISQLLPSIIQHINLADFIAFDCEFSGLTTKLDRIQGLFPNHIQFYERIKQTAYNFRLFQLGITTFIFDGKNYIPKPYNFYINPNTYTPTYNNVMICEVESMEFLANNNLDFSKVFKSGIQSQRLFSKNDVKQKHHNHSGPPLDYKNIFFSPQDKQLVSEIENIILPMKETPKIQKIINFKSKNILTYFKSKYTNLLTDKPKKNMDIYQYNVRMLKKLIDMDINNQQKHEQEIKVNYCSLQIVLEAIIKGRKPIIGHFPNLDIGLIYHSFLKDIPDTYEQFCYQINQYFPYIIDTKVLSRRIQSKLKGLKVDLSSLFKACFNQKLLQKYTNIDFESSKQYLWKEHTHEAGYDSFITGCAFVGMANFMMQSSDRINFQALQNQNKLLYSRFAGEVSINGNMFCASAIDNQSKIIIQSLKMQENVLWRQHAQKLSQYGNLSVYEDHQEIYYVYQNVRNIAEIIKFLPDLKLKYYSQRKIVRARNMYKLEKENNYVKYIQNKKQEIDYE